jgi:endoglucanase
MVAVRPWRGLVLLLAGGVAVACMAPTPPTPTPTPAPPTPTPVPYGTGPLRASGGKLVEAAGREVRLTGVNWSGLETSSFAPIGLWSQTIDETLDQMVAVGFNTLRLPYSNQLFEPRSKPDRIDFRKNPDLRDISGLQIMDRIVEGARQRGLRVLLDRHQPTSERRTELWYTDRIPEERWIRDWVMLARRYRGNEAVIGAELHTEPHNPATWGDGNEKTDWRLAAERAGNAILEANPDWLIVVEGVEDADGTHYWWGGNLSAAGRAPVRLSRPDRLVYSVHDYGPDESEQVWFNAPDYPLNMPELWRRYWAYLKLDGIAPVLVGEFGGRSVSDDTSGVWQRTLVEYIEREGFNYTYWVWNQDDWVGGLVRDNSGRLDQAKLSLLARSQWPFMGERQPIARPSEP